jgi:hypothetical protein
MVLREIATQVGVEGGVTGQFGERSAWVGRHIAELALSGHLARQRVVERHALAVCVEPVAVFEGIGAGTDRACHPFGAEDMRGD